MLKAAAFICKDELLKGDTLVKHSGDFFKKLARFVPFLSAFFIFLPTHQISILIKRHELTILLCLVEACFELIAAPVLSTSRLGCFKANFNWLTIKVSAI